MELQRLTQCFRHLLRSILNETDEELGQPFDEIAAYMADLCLDLARLAVAENWDDHRFDLQIQLARDDVKRFAGLNGSHPDHRHILGAVQGALAIAVRALKQ